MRLSPQDRLNGASKRAFKIDFLLERKAKMQPKTRKAYAMQIRPDVSFVMPARNEEPILRETIASINNVIGDAFSYEIILIDNGSIDRTSEVAINMGAKVTYQPEGRLGGLRNTGARLAAADILVFLDADVILDTDWLNPFMELREKLKTSPMLISGSRCQIPDDASSLARSWFWASKSSATTSHIGTGHMVTSMTLFRKIQGFDEELITGEDFDFCVRAKASGATILRDQRLKVFHFGYPNSLKQFFLREIWHGSGDAESLKRIIESKVALTAIFFLGFHFVAIFGLVTRSSIIIAGALLGIFATCVGSSIYKYRDAPTNIICQNSASFYIYYWARAISVVNGIFRLKKPSSPRNTQD
jgi:glycosyltransferase involved in cell wall biosynthesis